jgi:MFS family permease
MPDDTSTTSFYHKPAGVFGTRIPSSVCFAVGLLLFLLPFAELRCKPNSKALNVLNIQVIGTNTGLGLALGADWNFDRSSDTNPYSEDRKTPTDRYNRKGLDPNIYAIIALSLAALGLCLSFVKRAKAAAINSITGLLAAGALIGLLFDLIRQSKYYIGDEKANGPDEVMHSTVVFTPWFYSCVIVLLVASFFSYKRMQLLKRSPSSLS